MYAVKLSASWCRLHPVVRERRWVHNHCVSLHADSNSDYGGPFCYFKAFVGSRMTLRSHVHEKNGPCRNHHRNHNWKGNRSFWWRVLQSFICAGQVRGFLLCRCLGSWIQNRTGLPACSEALADIGRVCSFSLSASFLLLVWLSGVRAPFLSTVAGCVPNLVCWFSQSSSAGELLSWFGNFHIHDLSLIPARVMTSDLNLTTLHGNINHRLGFCGLETRVASMCLAKTSCEGSISYSIPSPAVSIVSDSLQALRFFRLENTRTLFRLVLFANLSKASA